jgi:Na+-transporting NADH:ubiquinone oxidoreductase subunit D
MSIALTLVTAFSNLFISMIRNQIPSSIRMIVQMVIIARWSSWWTRSCKAYALPSFEAAVGVRRPDHHQLHRDGPCRSLRHAEPAGAVSFMDGIGNGLGYSAMLITLGVIRELFGAGKLLGYRDHRHSSRMAAGTFPTVCCCCRLRPSS